LRSPTNVKKVRQKLRAARKALSAQEREKKSILILQHLSGYLPFRRAKKLAAYWATDEEVATSNTIEYANRVGKAVYLPVIIKARCGNETMHFHRYIPGKTALTLNSFGIAEPEYQCTSSTPSGVVDLILVPLVGFNQNRDRIGMGGGYYDRTLSNFDIRSTNFVGLAFACQKAEFDPMPHDVRLHAIITEDGIVT